MTYMTEDVNLLTRARQIKGIFIWITSIKDFCKKLGGTLILVSDYIVKIQNTKFQICNLNNVTFCQPSVHDKMTTTIDQFYQSYTGQNSITTNWLQPLNWLKLTTFAINYFTLTGISLSLAITMILQSWTIEQV